MPDAEEGHPRQRAEAARLRGEAIRKNAEEVRRRAAAAHDRSTSLAEGLAARSGQTGHTGQPGSPSPPQAAARRTAQPDGAISAGLRIRGAEMSERMARAADTFADYLEDAAERGDRDRRLGIARVEREIAAIERRNAARLRHPDDPSPLESLPDLPKEEALKRRRPRSSSPHVPVDRG